jgi:hypothetical protein
VEQQQQQQQQQQQYGSQQHEQAHGCEQALEAYVFTKWFERYNCNVCQQQHALGRSEHQLSDSCSMHWPTVVLAENNTWSTAGSAAAAVHGAPAACGGESQGQHVLKHLQHAQQQQQQQQQLPYAELTWCEYVSAVNFLKTCTSCVCCSR